MANFRSIAVALVPGMNSLASSTFIPLAKNLTTYGKVEVIDLPSVGANETKVSLKPNALQADIDSIHDCLSRVIDEGFDVFVVAHAYGGTPALYACEGLWKSQNPIAGVLGVGLIASSLTLPGKSVAEMRTDWDKVHARVSDGAVQMEVVDDELFILPEGFQDDWFCELGDDDRVHWKRTLLPSPLECVVTPAPLTDVTQWKVEYIVTTDRDSTMPVDFQHHLIESAKEAGAKVNFTSISSDHFAHVSHAGEIADWIQSSISVPQGALLTRIDRTEHGPPINYVTVEAVSG